MKNITRNTINSERTPISVIWRNRSFTRIFLPWNGDTNAQYNLLPNNQHQLVTC